MRLRRWRHDAPEAWKGNLMSKEEPDLPIDLLLYGSERTLQDFELAELNRCSNTERAFRDLWRELIEQEARALFAAWIRKYRAKIVAELRGTDSLQKTLDFAGGPLADPRPILGPKKSGNTDAGNQGGKLAVG
jgi:hypothetical protein